MARINGAGGGPVAASCNACGQMITLTIPPGAWIGPDREITIVDTPMNNPSDGTCTVHNTWRISSTPPGAVANSTFVHAVAGPNPRFISHERNDMPLPDSGIALLGGVTNYLPTLHSTGTTASNPSYLSCIHD